MRCCQAVACCGGHTIDENGSMCNSRCSLVPVRLAPRSADLKEVNMLMAVLVPASAGPYACFDLASVGLRWQCSDATCRVDVKEGT